MNYNISNGFYSFEQDNISKYILHVYLRTYNNSKSKYIFKTILALYIRNDEY